MADNLERQGGIYHARLAIPKDVQQAFGNRRILSKSLDTADRNEALRRRLPCLAKWKAQIHAARSARDERGDAWKESAADYAASITEAAEASKIAVALRKPEPYSNDAPSPEITAAMTSLFSDPEYMGAMQQLAAIRKEQGTDGQLALRDDLQEIVGSLFQQVIAQSEGLNTLEIEELSSLFDAPDSYKPKSPITATRLREFRAHRTAHAQTPKAIDSQEAKLNKLSAYLGETGKPLDFDSVAAFLNTLEGLTSKTKSQYLLAGNVFWKWAIKYDTQWREQYKGLASPFENHDLPQLRGRFAKEAKRKAFEREDIPVLYAAALAKNDATLATLIKLGAYTGARIEELCQLKVENIILVEGVSCFDIVDSKTVAGIRQVPVHLAILGMVKQLVQDSQDGWLLPIKTKNMYGIRSDALSKRFGRLKTELGFGPLHVFHSIRHTVTTSLHQADLPLSTVQQLLGHETKTVTLDTYSKGLSAAQKLEAITKISYPFH
ncbi:MAG TPA: site-specific integrase [Pseudomonas sp.]|nr:site-specific integrase [Pseudomonas sp.]